MATGLAIAQKNVYRSLTPLIDAGVLLESTDKKRQQLWRAPEVRDALDRFATSGGRRARASD